MIKGKKANLFSNKIVSIFSILVIFLILFVMLTRGIDSSKDNVDSNLNISNFIEEKIKPLFKDEIPDDVKDDLYSFSYQLLHNNENEKATKTIGKLVSIPVKFEGTNYVIGFKKLEGEENLIYLSTFNVKSSGLITNDLDDGKTSNYLSYKDILSEQEYKELRGEAYSKRFVVIPYRVSSSFEDSAFLMHYITGLDFSKNKYNSQVVDNTPAINSEITRILSKYEVQQVAIRSLNDKGDDDISIAYLNDKAQASISPIATSLEGKIMVYYYKNFVVFFIATTSGFDLNSNNKLSGLGNMDQKLLEELIDLKGYVIER